MRSLALGLILVWPFRLALGQIERQKNNISQSVASDRLAAIASLPNQPTPSCVRNIPNAEQWGWVQISISETIILETIVTIVNRRKDATRVETLTNSAIDLSRITKPPNINNDGTQIHFMTDIASNGSGSSIVTM